MLCYGISYIFFKKVLMVVGLFWGTVHSLEFAVDAPKQARHNVKESLILTATGANPRQSISIQVEILSQTNEEYFSVRNVHRFTKDFHTFHIPFKVLPPFEKCQTTGSEVNSELLCSVSLTISVSDSFILLWREKVDLDVIKTPGKMFIQTDRPMYFPGDEAYVRFMPLTDDFLLMREKSLLTIESPGVGGTRMISWQKAHSFTKQPYVRKFKIPPDSLLGEWKISAIYTSNTTTDEVFQSTFHVAYKSIPSFKVNIEYLSNDFILPEDEEFNLKISARSFHNKPITGMGQVQFGMVSPLDDDFVMMTHVINDLRLVDGEKTFTIPVAQLIGVEAMSLVSGRRLLVIASVTEHGTGESQTTRDDSVVFSSEPYTMKFIKNRQFFQPGVPVIANVQLNYPNGSLAIGVDVDFILASIDVFGFETELHRVTSKTCGLGTAMTRTTESTHGQAIKVTASAKFLGHNGHIYVTKTSELIQARISDTTEYIHIETPQERLQIDTSAIIQVYIKPASGERLMHYYVTKNGKYLVQQSATIGRGESDILIHLPIIPSMSPAITLTAYYFSGGNQDIIEDRNVLYIEKACHGETPEVFLNGPDSQYPRPGAQLNLEVRADPSSIISMIGSDEALDSVNIGTNRESAEDIEEGRYAPAEICEHGRQYIGTMRLSNFSPCNDVTSKRRKRSLIDKGTIMPLVSFAYKYTGAMFDCCIVGARDMSSYYSHNNMTCHQRRTKVQVGHLCQQTFMKCCLIAECMRNTGNNLESCMHSHNKETKVFLRTVTRTYSPFTQEMKTSFMVEKSVELRRKNFNPTWFFLDFQMNGNGRKMLANSSMPSLPVLPDRITTWNVDVISSSADKPLCFGTPLKLPVEHHVYIDVRMSEEPVVVGTQVSAEVTIYNHIEEEVETHLYLEGDDRLCSKATLRKNYEGSRYTLLPAYRNNPTTTIERFTMIPLKSGKLKVKFKLLARYGGNSRPNIDQVEKILEVLPDGELKKQVSWVLVDSNHKGYALRRNKKKKKSLPLFIPDNAIPGTDEVKISAFSIPSASMNNPSKSTTESTTIQEILYQLYPAVSKVEFLRNRGISGPDIEEKLIDTIQESYHGLLGYLQPVKNERQHDFGSVDEPDHYGFSYSPVTSSTPTMHLTSIVVKLLYRIKQFTKIDTKLLRGSLYWIIHHQTSTGYFKTKTSEVADKTVLRRRKRNAAKDRFLMSASDKRIYFTSTIMLDLISIKNTMENEPSFDWNSEDYITILTSISEGQVYLRKRITKVISQGTRQYSSTAFAAAAEVFKRLEDRFSFKAAVRAKTWKRTRFGTIDNDIDIAWIQNRPYNPARRVLDQKDIDTNNIVATSHMLSHALLKGFRGDEYANWLIMQRNQDGHWTSFRANMAAMEALRLYSLRSNVTNLMESFRIELDDTKNTNISVSSNNIGDPGAELKINIASPTISYSTTGQGKAWLKIDTSYRTATPTVKSSRAKVSPIKSVKSSHAQLPSCIYDVTVGLQESSRTFLLPQSRSSQRSRLAWDVGLSVKINEFYNSDEEFQSYVVEFGLPVGSKAFESDLQKLSNPIEHIIDHYRVTGRSALFYITGDKDIIFRITDTYIKDEPIPIKIYPLAAPENSCEKFYNFPGLPSQIVTFCPVRTASSKELCVCAKGKTCSTPIKSKKSLKYTLDKRKEMTCGRKSTFAYKVRFTKKTIFSNDWFQYDGIIKTIYRHADGTNREIRESTSHIFWTKRVCKNLPLRKDQLVIGHAVLATSDGKYKHFLDANSWVEQWPNNPGNCGRSNTNTCKAYDILEEYEYIMKRYSCSTS